jgi:cytochrome oxidase assembly protein ShyY1
VRYRFLWSPRWIIGHLIVIALAITMVELGFWQLRRLHEKEDRRDTLRTELAAEPVPLAQTPDPRRFQRVSLTGRYDGTTLLIGNRTLREQPGYEVVSPFRLDDGGTTALVDRGWIPLAPTPEQLPPLDPPPTGPLSIVGIVDHQPGDAVIWDTAGAALVRSALPSTTTIQLQTQDQPLAAGQPIPLDPPDSSLGPHLSYTIQWFMFTVMLLVFYPLLARHSANQREKAARIAAADAASSGDGRGDLGGPAVPPRASGLELGGQAEQDVLLAEAPGELHADR